MRAANASARRISSTCDNTPRMCHAETTGPAFETGGIDPRARSPSELGDERLRPQASAGGKSRRPNAQRWPQRPRARSERGEAGPHASEVDGSEPRWNRTINSAD